MVKIGGSVGLIRKTAGKSDKKQYEKDRSNSSKMHIESNLCSVEIVSGQGKQSSVLQQTEQHFTT